MHRYQRSYWSTMWCDYDVHFIFLRACSFSSLFFIVFWKMRLWCSLYIAVSSSFVQTRVGNGTYRTLIALFFRTPLTSFHTRRRNSQQLKWVRARNKQRRSLSFAYQPASNEELNLRTYYPEIWSCGYELGAFNYFSHTHTLLHRSSCLRTVLRMPFETRR